MTCIVYRLMKGKMFGTGMKDIVTPYSNLLLLKNNKSR